jgi:hypothetical protein
MLRPLRPRLLLRAVLASDATPRASHANASAPLSGSSVRRAVGRRSLAMFSLSSPKRVKGIEPSYEAWKATALPLSYTRDLNGECRIRTCEDRSHQIYSLTPLTARETPPESRVFQPQTPPKPAGTLSPATLSCSCPWRTCEALIAPRGRQNTVNQLAEGLEPTTC